MKRACLAVVSAAATWLLAASDAAACSFRRPESAQAHLAGADVLFVGQVDRIVTVKLGGQRYNEVTFRVDRTLKGERLRLRIVRYPAPNMCVQAYREGQVYTVLGYAKRRSTFISPGPLLFSAQEYERAARAARRGR